MIRARTLRDHDITHMIKIHKIPLCDHESESRDRNEQSNGQQTSSHTTTPRLTQKHENDPPDSLKSLITQIKYATLLNSIFRNQWNH